MTRKDARQFKRVLPAGIAMLVLMGSPPMAQSAPTPERFDDAVSGFTIIKPEAWHQEEGPALSAQAQAEARRYHDPKLGPPPTGSPTELLVRFTQYAPGQAPGPNPTVVAVRFDLQQFPPRTSPENLLRMGLASAHIEEGPTTVELGGRSWQKMRGSRILKHPSGATIEVVQEVYVAQGARWAIGLTISATREQYVQLRAVFDGVLQSVRFQSSAASMH